MDADNHARFLLVALTALSMVTLLVVVVDKPFRDPDHPDDVGDTMTLADNLMVFSQLSQLTNYLVAFICLRDQAQQISKGTRDLSPKVELTSGLVGFGLIVLQAVALAYTYLKEGEEAEEHQTESTEKQRDGGHQQNEEGEANVSQYHNPL